MHGLCLGEPNKLQYVPKGRIRRSLRKPCSLLEKVMQVCNRDQVADFGEKTRDLVRVAKTEVESVVNEVRRSNTVTGRHVLLARR